MWNCDNPYAYREENLRKLGFSSYRGYLRSDLWRSIKARAIKAAGKRCSRCGSRNSLQVHHRSYDLHVLAGSRLDALTVACASCHYRAERPDDRSRSRWDRLSGANEFITSRPSLMESAWRWFKERGSTYWTCDDPEAAVVRIIAIYEKAARCQSDGRCPMCNRRFDNAKGSRTIDGAEFCGWHSFGEVRAFWKAVEIVEKFGVTVAGRVARTERPKRGGDLPTIQKNRSALSPVEQPSIGSPLVH